MLLHKEYITGVLRLKYRGAKDDRDLVEESVVSFHDTFKKAVHH